MADILTFVNQKGGSGKSKSVLGLGPELAALSRRVLIVDTDPQCTQTNALIGRNQDVRGLAEALGAGNVPEEERPKIDELIIPVPEFGVDLLPSHFNRVSNLVTELNADQSRVADLNYALDAITTPYDYILIDTPGDLGPMVMSSIMAASHVIVAIDSGTEALEGFANLQSALKRASRLSDFTVLGVISTRYKARTDLSKTVLDSVRDATDYPFYATIRESTKIAAMNQLRQPLSKIAKNRPEHQDFIDAAKAIDKLLVGSKVPA